MNYGKLANVLGTVLLIALVAPFLIYAVPGAVGADHSFVVLSGSMEPEISTGDVVIVAENDPATIEEGDVITFVRDNENSPVTHRVIGVESGESGLAFQTKGDANEGPDRGTVPAGNVIGTVVLTLPFVGYVVRFVNTPIGFALLVGLPIGALLLTEAWSILRAGDDDRPDGDDEDPTEGGGEPTGTVVDDGRARPGIPRSARERGAGTSAAVEASGDGGEITINPTDLTWTVLVLVLFTPYAAYVAITLQTTTTITIAFATGFSALALGGLWLAATFDEDDRDAGERGGTDARASMVSRTAEYDATPPADSNDGASEPGSTPRTGVTTERSADLGADGPGRPPGRDDAVANGSDGGLEHEHSTPSPSIDGRRSMDEADARRGNGDR